MIEHRAPEHTFDLREWSKAVTELTERSCRLWAEGFGQHLSEGGGALDPVALGRAFLECALKFRADPNSLAEAQARFWTDWVDLCRATARRLSGGAAEPVIRPDPQDRRFKHESWNEDVCFDFIKQAYLLASRWVRSSICCVDGVDARTERKLDFCTRQLIDAMSPTNFAATNPQVWQEAKATGGKSLLSGFENLLNDLERGRGRLSVSMTDLNAFKVGENIAATPGKVVYQNDLMQLIQYAPATDAVFRRPLLIVPPWINKYYILDLQPANSFIRWAVENGHTVFVISWVNPDESLAHKSFEDYMVEGPLAALDAVELATGEREVNAIGYCIGGTLLSSTLAYQAARGEDRVKSVTFFTSLVDFAEPGEVSVFIDELQLARLDERMRTKGYLDGSHMAGVFNMLRANDLIWSFVVNNYLLGKTPKPFDLLYWNSDSTRMPAAMHSFYLRKMYLENQLVVPGGISLQGVPIDLRSIRTPAYILSTREDHIAPWKSTYTATQLYSGPVKFVLGASGHIAGVLNPPSAGKYSYWTNSRKPKAADGWFKGAKEQPGSWWPDWARWVDRFSGGRTPARLPGESALASLEDAPGSYVKMRC